MGSQTGEPDWIPGTDYVFDYNVDNDVQKDGDIILIPQPTISPNDPLNWSKARKYIHLLLLLLFTGLTAATSNSPGSSQDGIQAEYPDISDNVFNTGDGVLFLGIGWWTLFSAPSVHLFGSRIGYLVGVLLSIAGNAWYANCTRVTDVVWSQLFIGASESVCEAVVQLSITQVFFQHQATHYIGVYVLAISIGTFLGPLIGGFIADDINWHWVGYMGVISSGFVGVLLLFGLEETYFDRAHFVRKRATDNVGQNTNGNELSPTNSASDAPLTDVINSDQSYISEKNNTKKINETITDTDDEGLNPVLSARPDIVDEEKQDVADKPKTYWQRIALITPAVNLKGLGIKQYLMRILLTLRVLAFPPVLYSGLQWGAQDAWLSFYIDLEETVYYDAPYNYSDAAVGIMNIPSLIGATIGCLYGAWFSDWFVMWCAKRNGGIREAETRLWCLLPAGLISPAGMFLLGVGTQRGWAWYAPYVGLAMIGFGWGCCGDLSMSYLVDCYPEMILEGMVGVSLINNNIATVFSFVVDRWQNAIGVQNTFISIGVLNFFFVFLSIPMIYYGKRCRRWTKNMYINFVEARDSLDA